MRVVETNSNKEYQRELNNYIATGYKTKEQTTTSTSLELKKKVSIGLCILWFILGVWPLIIYLLYCAFRKPQDEVLLELNLDDKSE